MVACSQTYDWTQCLCWVWATFKFFNETVVVVTFSVRWCWMPMMSWWHAAMLCCSQVFCLMMSSVKMMKVLVYLTCYLSVLHWLACDGIVPREVRQMQVIFYHLWRLERHFTGRDRVLLEASWPGPWPWVASPWRPSPRLGLISCS